VLRQACLQAGAGRSSGLELRMSVNGSSRQLTSGLSTEELEELLGQNGLEPSGLMLEITESLMVDGRDAILSWLERASALGIGLAVDKFGTGCSSLGNLKRFPVDTLKIDRSFVRGLPDDAEDAALIKAIVAMARRLGLRVVAEGVETNAQLAFLQGLGCELAQGYLFSRPVAAEQVPELARRFAAAHRAATEAEEPDDT
jgi:EAL domain-containing protein (putative c-di-GMP-specific phosphodiesterase class I)